MVMGYVLSVHGNLRLTFLAWTDKQMQRQTDSHDPFGKRKKPTHLSAYLSRLVCLSACLGMETILAKRTSCV